MGDCCSKDKNGDQDGFTRVIPRTSKMPLKGIDDQKDRFLTDINKLRNQNTGGPVNNVERLNSDPAEEKIKKTDETSRAYLNVSPNKPYSKFNEKGSKELLNYNTSEKDGDSSFIVAKNLAKNGHLLTLTERLDESDIYEVFT